MVCAKYANDGVRVGDRLLQASLVDFSDPSDLNDDKIENIIGRKCDEMI